MRFLAAGVLAVLFLVPPALGRDDSIYLIGEPGTVKLGPHLALSQGGDVNEEDLSYGIQFAYQFTRFFSLDLSVAEISDTLEPSLGSPGLEVEGDIGVDLAAIALTARIEIPVLPWIGVYGGAGVGYYISDADKDLTVTAVEPYDDIGAPTDYSVSADDKFGYHLAAGAFVRLHEHVEIFGEYRWTYLDPTVEVEANVRSVDGELLASDSQSFSGYDFGLFRVGINFYY